MLNLVTIILIAISIYFVFNILLNFFISSLNILLIELYF
jgi:hypothetical protein